MVYVINKTTNRTRNLGGKSKRKKEFFAKEAEKVKKEKGEIPDDFKQKAEKKWKKKSPYNS